MREKRREKKGERSAERGGGEEKREKKRKDDSFHSKLLMHTDMHAHTDTGPTSLLKESADWSVKQQ